MGGSAKYLSELIGSTIIPQNKYENLEEILFWANKNFPHILHSLDGYLKRIQAAFVQGDNDGIQKLALNFYINEVEMFKDVGLFIKIIERHHKRYAPKTYLYPELSIKWTDDPKGVYDIVSKIISYNWFKSIDICGEELSRPAINFKEIYKIAEKKQITIKVHVGEKGSANDVMNTIDTLRLNQVHHGISAASSKEVMNYLSKNKIQLNVCPTSNIKLGLVLDYYNHPIQTLYRNGVLVTINTDDMLCFNSSISNEYSNLYQAGTLSAEELDNIRIFGLLANE